MSETSNKDFGTWRLEAQQVNKVLIGPYIILLEPWLALQWTINSETVSASASILIDPVISSFCKKKVDKIIRMLNEYYEMVVRSQFM